MCYRIIQVETVSLLLILFFALKDQPSFAPNPDLDKQ